MKTDLLKIYAKSNLGSLTYVVLIVFAFIAARIQFYGIPSSPDKFFTEVGIYGVILFVIALCFMRTRDLYRIILAEKHALPLSDDFAGIVRWIAVLKLIYMTLWLYFLCMPLEGASLYHCALSLFFTFCALGVYASVSASYLPLFLWDMAIQLGFSFMLLWLHRDRWEVPYLATILLMFSAYSFISGLRIRNTTKLLIETGDALKKAAHNANRANKSKSEFLAVMSHEIRTPMTGILGMVDALAETKLTPEQKASVDAITECSETLLNTLNDILDLSRIEAGKITISNTNFDLHGVLENIVRILSTVAADQNIELRLSIGDDVPRHIFADPHRIRQCVMNLVGNAIKFTHAGYVEISASMKRNSIHIAVKDTGIGIDPEKSKHLFKSFTQADSSISREYGGSGLGLSITKQLVEKMEGKIGFESAIGAGSTFWFEIPYKEPVPELRKDSQHMSSPDTAPQNILLVEDNRINQMMCSRLLTQKGHQVTVANDGHMALDLARHNSYDLILMDCSLPGKSGIDTARDIRMLGGKYKRVPIIALTANGMEDHLKKCIDAGMNDTIVKPYRPDALYRSIAAHVGSSSPSPVLNGVLKSLEEEMGSEYTAHLVRSSINEIAYLSKKIILSGQRQDYADLEQAAHDAKAVSGTIGLEDLQGIAQAIERACISKDYASIPDLIERLQKALPVSSL